MNEGEYLEMCNRLQQIFDIKEKEKIDYVKKYNRLYKILCVIYGLIRVFQQNDDDLCFHHLIDEIRTLCSDELFKHLENTDND